MLITDGQVMCADLQGGDYVSGGDPLYSFNVYTFYITKNDDEHIYWHSLNGGAWGTKEESGPSSGAYTSRGNWYFGPVLPPGIPACPFAKPAKPPGPPPIFGEVTIRAAHAKPRHPKLPCCGWCGGLLYEAWDHKAGKRVMMCEVHEGNPPIVQDNAGTRRHP